MEESVVRCSSSAVQPQAPELPALSSLGLLLSPLSLSSWLSPRLEKISKFFLVTHSKTSRNDRIVWEPPGNKVDSQSLVNVSVLFSPPPGTWSHHKLCGWRWSTLIYCSSAPRSLTDGSISHRPGSFLSFHPFVSVVRSVCVGQRVSRVWLVI